MISRFKLESLGYRELQSYRRDRCTTSGNGRKYL